MYNKIKIFLLSICTLLVTSCVSDDCNLDRTTRIVFSYEDDQGNEVINKYVHSATLYVYDELGELFATYPLSKDELANRRGVSAELPLGTTLTAVCWANLGENTQVENIQSFDSAFLHAKNLGSSDAVATDDQLYHGIETFKFSPKSTVDDRQLVLNLNSKHIKFNVEVIGLNKADTPLITLMSKQPQYNFLGEFKESVTQRFSPKAAYDPLDDVHNASLSFLKPENIEQLTLEVTSHLNTDVSKLVDLKSVIEEKYPNLNLNSNKEIEINILVEFDGVDIIITVPDWDEDNTQVGVH